MLIQVVEDVGLALNLARELLGVQVGQRALLAFDDLVALHFSNVGGFIILINLYGLPDYKVLLDSGFIRDSYCGKDQFGIKRYSQLVS